MSLMVSTVNERIKVFALFERGNLKPIRFFWRGRDYLIKKVEFAHFQNQGQARLYLFSVVGEEANYQLVFNSRTFSWFLSKIEAQ